jgi:putative Mg2+ transporter-C (MgtC) family protein
MVRAIEIDDSGRGCYAADMPADLALQFDLVGRLLTAAALGAVIGIEREISDQQAGLRTHLLVALGSALFTVVSIFGFANLGPGAAQGAVDPSRIAAQIVTGVGFLGAGAIIRQGISVRGLTTAASLWATAAIGLAAGAGQIVVAAAATVIMVLSLGPLTRVAKWLRGRGAGEFQVRLEIQELEAVGSIMTHLAGGSVDVAGVATRRIDPDRTEVTLLLDLASHGHPARVLDELASLPGVKLLDSTEVPRS